MVVVMYEANREANQLLPFYPGDGAQKAATGE